MSIVKINRYKCNHIFIHVYINLYIDGYVPVYEIVLIDLRYIFTPMFIFLCAYLHMGYLKVSDAFHCMLWFGCCFFFFMTMIFTFIASSQILVGISNCLFLC